jgi:hypothetical protein
MCDAGLIALTALISPFRQDRQMARELNGLGRFLEVHVNTPLDVCDEAPHAPAYVANAASQTVKAIVREMAELVIAQSVTAAS